MLITLITLKKLAVILTSNYFMFCDIEFCSCRCMSDVFDVILDFIIP